MSKTTNTSNILAVYLKAKDLKHLLYIDYIDLPVSRLSITGLLVIVEHLKDRGYHRVICLRGLVCLVIQIIELFEAKSGPFVRKASERGMLAVFF